MIATLDKDRVAHTAYEAASRIASASDAAAAALLLTDYAQGHRKLTAAELKRIDPAIATLATLFFVAADASQDRPVWQEETRTLSEPLDVLLSAAVCRRRIDSNLPVGARLIAALAGVSLATVWRSIRDGVLEAKAPHPNDPKRRWVFPDAAAAYLRERGVPAL
jgi:hypothetical protein